MISLILLAVVSASSGDGVRRVEATPCEVVDIRLSLGMSTILQFDTPPQLSFHADEERFDIKATDSANRVLAIIPKISGSEIERILSSDPSPQAASPRNVARLLDEYFRTNLFVFFKDSTRLIFRLRFTTKDQADYVVHVRQMFKEGCVL